MDDHFDTSGVFEISKFDIAKLNCICKLSENYSFTIYKYQQAEITLVFVPTSILTFSYTTVLSELKAYIVSYCFGCNCLLYNQAQEVLLKYTSFTFYLIAHAYFRNRY